MENTWQNFQHSTAGLLHLCGAGNCSKILSAPAQHEIQYTV